MNDRFRKASKGYSKSEGGLNNSELRKILTGIYPERKHEIHHLRREKLEMLAQQYIKSISINHPEQKKQITKIRKFEKASDALLIKYLLTLDDLSMISLCKVCKDCARICEEDSFWETKVKWNFGEETEKINDSWRETWEENDRK